MPVRLERSPCATHEIEGNASEKQEKKYRNDKGQSADQHIITGVIDSEGLQHAPESMTEMNCQDSEGKYIKETVKKAAEQFAHRHRDQHILGRKGETGDMDEEKEEDDQAAIGHGSRGEGVLVKLGVNRVTGDTDLTILEKQIDAVTDMDGKEDEKSQAEHQDDQRVAVQFIGIALKNLAAHKDCRITRGMGAEKQNEEEAGDGHDHFLTDRRFEKRDEPHKRTLRKRLSEDENMVSTAIIHKVFPSKKERIFLVIFVTYRPFSSR